MKTIRQSGVQAIAWVALSVLAPFASLAALISGDASEVASNVVHVNGNVYDQFLLTGVSATMTADPGQITRVSFLDIDEDILQVEFSGSGTLTVTLESATGPALAAKYHQPGVLYMRGHARIRISGSDASTNVSVFSVGASNALNQSIIKPGEVYDGVADLAELEIVPDPEVPFGSVFGGIRAGNASFWAQAGRVGIYAPRVHVQTVVRIADMQAFDNASPALVFGQHSQFGAVEVSEGGTLVQPNGRLIAAEYQFGINLSSSGGVVKFLDITFPTEPYPPGSHCYRYFTGPDGAPLLWVWVVPPART